MRSTADVPLTELYVIRIGWALLRGRYPKGLTCNACKHCTDMGNAEKRIPVTESTWQELGDMKSAGQSYDDLLSELIEVYKKDRLAEHVEELRARTDDDEFVPLDELDDDDG